MAPVVGEKNQEGVFTQAQFFQGTVNTTYTFIHAFDHGRIGRMLMASVCLLISVLLNPRLFCLNGRVNGIVSQVEKKWSVFVSAYKLYGFICKSVR